MEPSCHNRPVVGPKCAGLPPRLTRGGCGDFFNLRERSRRLPSPILREHRISHKKRLVIASHVRRRGARAQSAVESPNAADGDCEADEKNRVGASAKGGNSRHRPGTSPLSPLTLQPIFALNGGTIAPRFSHGAPKSPTGRARPQALRGGRLRGAFVWQRLPEGSRRQLRNNDHVTRSDLTRRDFLAAQPRRARYARDRGREPGAGLSPYRISPHIRGIVTLQSSIEALAHLARRAQGQSALRLEGGFSSRSRIASSTA